MNPKPLSSQANCREEDMASSVCLSIVIVSWNCHKLLRGCLNSLLRQESAPALEIIVVDNASQDETASMVVSEFPNVTLIQNNLNLGFACACNIGMKKAKGELLLLLNPDTEFIHSTSLLELSRFFIQNEKFSGAGCRLSFPGGEQQIGDAGYQPNLRTTFSHAFFLSRIFPSLFKGVFLSSMPKTHINRPLEVDWACGAAFCVRRNVLEQVGGLNESYFLYGEDVEWGCRITDQGYKIAYLPWISLTHIQGGTQQQNIKPNCRWIQGLARVYLERNGASYWLLYKLIFSSGFMMRLGIYFLSNTIRPRRDTSSKLSRMKVFTKHLLGLTPNQARSA